LREGVEHGGREGEFVSEISTKKTSKIQENKSKNILKRSNCKGNKEKKRFLRY
jgi:hypothetical protein